MELYLWILSSQKERVLSGGDRLYNYRNPPSTVDKANAERVIEEERQKRKLLDRDNQHLRRHSDFNPVKSPIITNDRFNDLLGEPPKVAEKPIPKWKQEELARKAEPTSPKPTEPEVKACALALYTFKAQSPKELSFAKGDTLYLRRDIDKNWFEGEHHGNVGIFPKAYIEVVTSIDEARQAMLSSPSTEGKARAKYKFKGETQLEMSFNKGDVIDLVKRIDNNWWDAKIGSRKGIVPASYMDVIREPSGLAAVASPGRSPLHSPPVNSTPTHMSQLASQDSYQYPSVMGSPSMAATNSKPKSSWDKDSYASLAQPERIQPIRQQPTQSAAPSSAPVHVVDPRGLMQQLQDKYKAVYPYLPNNDDELELEEGDIVLVMEKCDDGWFVGTSTRTHMFGTFPGNYVEKI